MEMSGLDSLSPEERDRIKKTLEELISYLRQKKMSSAAGRLLPDEQTVLTSLLNPERGDVVITVLYVGRDLFTFVSNRRNEDCPFVIMNSKEISKHTGRRTLDSSRLELEEGQAGLFICSFQDQEYLKDQNNKRFNIYSTHFGLSENKLEVAPDQHFEELKTKPLEQCNVADKWQIYKQFSDLDHRKSQIEKELFGFQLNYAKYKKSEKEELLLLTPTKYKELLGQLIRDMYPPGVRLSLKRDFKTEHKDIINRCHFYLQRLEDEIQDRIKPDNGEEYNRYLNEVKKMIASTLVDDPEFSRF